MAHTIRHKQKLVARVRRVRGQLDAVERALEAEDDCGPALQLIAACRGAMHALMVEILEGYIEEHVLGATASKAQSAQSARELVALVRAYVK